MAICDALVVGGGPAGSTCARALTRQGLDVLVLDQQVFPRDKVCAGWITPAVLETLEIDATDYAASRVLQPITGFRTGVIDGAEVQTSYPRTVSYGIRRCEFDHYLLARSGARLRLGEPVRSLVRRGDGWIVNGEIETRLLIGAGGHFCPVARLLGADSGAADSVVAAKEVEFAMDAAQQRACRVQAEVAELFFCKDLKGYGWCLRKDVYLNIGMGRQDRHHLSEHLDAFCDFLRQRGKIAQGMTQRFHGHAYLLHGHGARKLFDDGVLLIGDAAGLAYAESGEGIRPAVESALLAAATLIEARRNYRSSRLEPYQQRLHERLGGASRTQLKLPAAWQRFIGGKLLASAWFTRHVVLDRWFLHSRQGAMHKA